MSDDGPHDVWISKLSRGGMEVSSVEYVRHDRSILAPHPLEAATRRLLAVPNEEMSEELCLAWSSAYPLWESHIDKHGPDDPIPYHLQPLLVRAGRTILGEVQENFSELKSAVKAARECSNECEVNELKACMKAARELLEVDWRPQRSLIIPRSEEKPVEGGMSAFQSEIQEQRHQAAKKYQMIDLTPFPISDGDFNHDLVYLTKMHGDASKSLDEASRGEVHADRLLEKLGGAGARISASKIDVIEAMEKLSMLLDVATAHVNDTRPSSVGVIVPEAQPAAVVE